MAVQVLLYTADEFFLNQCKLLLSEDIRTFSVCSFSGRDRARDYLAGHAGKIQCVLADEDFLREGLPAGTMGVVLGEETVMEPDGAGLFALNIYQRKQDLLEELKQLLRAAGLVAGGAVRSGGTKVISFCSTQGGSGVSTLAYLTAVQAAQQGKTVYLNLEYAPCTSPFYPSDGRNAEEFLCAVKDRDDPGRTLLPALRRNDHGVYVFPTPVSMADQQDLSVADVRYIVEGLLNLGEAAYLLVDLPAGFGEVNSYVMSISDRVVMVYGDDRVGRAKRRQLTADPAFSSYPCAGRELLVGNRCKRKDDGGDFDVCFPQSNTLAGDADVGLVVQGNPDFARGCCEILRL